MVVGIFEVFTNGSRIIALRKRFLTSVKQWTSLLACVFILISSIYQLKHSEYLERETDVSTNTKSLWALPMLLYILKTNYNLNCFDGIRSLINKILKITANIKEFFGLLAVNLTSFAV